MKNIQTNKFRYESVSIKSVSINDDMMDGNILVNKLIYSQYLASTLPWYHLFIKSLCQRPGFQMTDTCCPYMIIGLYSTGVD